MHNRAPSELRSVSTGVPDFFGLIHLVLLLFFSQACMNVHLSYLAITTHLITFTATAAISGHNATSLIITVTMNTKVKIKNKNPQSLKWVFINEDFVWHISIIWRKQIDWFFQDSIMHNSTDSACVVGLCIACLH